MKQGGRHRKFDDGIDEGSSRLCSQKAAVREIPVGHCKTDYDSYIASNCPSDSSSIRPHGGSTKMPKNEDVVQNDVEAIQNNANEHVHFRFLKTCPMTEKALV